MKTPAKKPIIGIMGGICSGKSAVAAEFAKLGSKVIDADKIAHQFLENTAVKERIVDCFSDRVLNRKGKIDRRKLADIAFSATDKLASLNEILHPLVLDRVEQLIEKYSHQPSVKAIVLDMPLLLETGWAERCDRLIFVDCETTTRAARAKKIGLFHENQFEIRENFQISLDNKIAIADNIVNNNSDFSALSEQVANIFSYIVDNG